MDSQLSVCPWSRCLSLCQSFDGIMTTLCDCPHERQGHFPFCCVILVPSQRRLGSSWPFVLPYELWIIFPNSRKFEIVWKAVKSVDFLERNWHVYCIKAVEPLIFMSPHFITFSCMSFNTSFPRNLIH